MKYNFKNKDLLISLFSVILFLLLWEYVSNNSTLYFALFSKPTFIIYKFILLITKHNFLFHLFISLKILFSSLFLSFIFWLSLSSISYYNNTFYSIIRPYVYFFNSVPIITLVPLFIVWLWFWDISKIFALTLILWPIFFIKIYDWYTNIQKELIALWKSFNMSFLSFFKFVILFSLYPYILTSFRLSIWRAVIGIIIVDVYGYGRWLGYLFWIFSAWSDIPWIMVIIFMLSGLNFSLVSMIYIINKWLSKKYYLGDKNKFF